MYPCDKGVQLTRALGRGAWGFFFSCEDMAMTVRELRAALATIEAHSEVQVVLFKNDGTNQVFELEEVLSNNGYAQLEIYEAESVREENPEG
jgi:hypothetical protein